MNPDKSGKGDLKGGHGVSGGCRRLPEPTDISEIYKKEQSLTVRGNPQRREHK